MNICVCVDDAMGMSFFGKRLSRDKAMTEKLLSHTEYDKILISEYSAPLFSDTNDARVCVTSDEYASCTERDICFFELEHITEYADKIEQIIIYKWNRKYPSDKKFPFSPADKGFTLTSTHDFAGNSHDNITEEIWTK